MATPQILKKNRFGEKRTILITETLENREDNMANIKMKLVDSDYVVRAKMDLPWMAGKDELEDNFREIDEELLTGKTAHFEIEDLKKDAITFEISKIE